MHEHGISLESASNESALIDEAAAHSGDLLEEKLDDKGLGHLHAEYNKIALCLMKKAHSERPRPSSPPRHDCDMTSLCRAVCSVCFYPDTSASERTRMTPSRRQGKVTVGVWCRSSFSFCQAARIADVKAYLRNNPIDKNAADQRGNLELHSSYSLMLSTLRRACRDDSSAGFYSTFANGLLPNDFKGTLRNYMKAVGDIMSQHFDNAFVEIASMLHELVSAMLVSSVEGAGAATSSRAVPGWA